MRKQVWISGHAHQQVESICERMGWSMVEAASVCAAIGADASDVELLKIRRSLKETDIDLDDADRGGSVSAPCGDDEGLSPGSPSSRRRHRKHVAA